MKSVSQYALPARAAERLLEIARAMDQPHGWVDIGQLNYAFLREGASPEGYRAGIEKLKANDLITIQIRFHTPLWEQKARPWPIPGQYGSL
jgi:hypothetical protein